MEKTQFRNYETGHLLPAVRENYRKMRQNQTVAYVRRMQAKYLTFDHPMTIRQALEGLNDFVDLSDPDMDLPNVQHLLQAAEGARRAGKPDWFQLVALIHDLGKVMYLWGCDEDGTSLKEQWGLVGDIFLVGCQLPQGVVFPEFNELNPDMENPDYFTPLGMYEANCGIDNCLKAWGHDEYLFQVLSHHPENRIPEAGMIMVRYHSFYPWHSHGAYSLLDDDRDEQYKEWVREFNLFDLYTKAPVTYNLDQLMEYYQPIIEKYLGKAPVYF
ncbi:MAG: Myo-inositol oxygenase [Bacteroidia bacterium]|nr:Myo-inositol oxygenase [Bacteroidia bacterium]